MNRIQTRLCASCYEKMRKLYRLDEVPAVYQRMGYNKCSLCDFTGQLTVYSYDPERDRRTPQERQRMNEREANAQKQDGHRAEPERQGCIFSAADFDMLSGALERM